MFVALRCLWMYVQHAVKIFWEMVCGLIYYGRSKYNLSEPTLGKVITYKSCNVKKTKVERVLARDAPPTVTVTSGMSYEFRQAGSADAVSHTSLEIRQVVKSCAGDWVPVPIPGATSVHCTPLGLIFYNPKELQDTFVVEDDTEETPGMFGTRSPCKFNPCNKAGCTFSHNIACRFGVGCRDKLGSCNMVHPDPSSVVPIGSAYPLTVACKFGPACSDKRCHFAHPNGRLGRLERTQKPIFATHNHDLMQLEGSPIPIEIGEAPKGANKFTFQGEFIFFYTPFPGPWAREHFKTVTIHRFDAETSKYSKLGDYELDGHYCNTAVGVGNFFILSWWPFEDEAMRAIWEAGRQLREQNKALLAKDRALAAAVKDAERANKEKDEALAASSAALAKKDAKIRGLKKQVT